MKYPSIPLLTILFAVFFFSCNKPNKKTRVLVFSKAADYRHSSITVGKQAIINLGNANDFIVDTTENADIFTEDSLKNYAAVIFLNTTGDVLNNQQEVAFERYIQSGGGYMGIHSATDTEYDWGWYGQLVGAYFDGHPDDQKATLIIKDNQHISTKHLPASWSIFNEWYNFKKIQKDLHVLITIDEKSYNGGTNGDNHPMAWYHDFDGGRAFYTELGHTEDLFSNPLYLQHILGGIKYAIGDNRELNYGKAKSEYAPDQDRFTKVSLVQGVLFEPTEMTILPNLDILVAQRRGDLVLYKNDSKQVKPAGSLNVYWKSHTQGVNAEEGLLGLQADPDFKNNHWVYIFYSPADTSVNRLSRFTFQNDMVDLTTEKIILQFYSQREICCHTGGSIAFGPGKTLFLSAGDNSTPFDEPKQKYVNHGFAPLNDLPGHEQYDARRSSGNSNDLRGKIMRIKIKDDGSYEIPDGNLFARNTPNTRPEIYVMGDRNPYRISVDKKNGYLYWGEVGPDANQDSTNTRGPRGYDEVNQARKPGFFGWPLFVGNNYPYHLYDYSNGSSGPAFDPQKPVNNSRNNTGVKELPPAQPAFIWYPYDKSHDFPEVGSGGRNAMAGPVYYPDMFPKSTRYPEYFDKKLFIYDWIRGWIKVVTMKENGDFYKMEPFIEQAKFSNPIDMEVGPDGKIYVLEYGSGWFAKNPDAGLSRIDYNGGNRPPVVSAVKVNKTSGNLPFTVSATVEAKDPEKDNLTYVWDFGNGNKEKTKVPKAEHTYSTPGDYVISVQVTDTKDLSANSAPVNVYAGNEQPVVDVSIEGNKTFYFADKPVKYAVKVSQGGAPAAVDTSGLMVIADFAEGNTKSAPLGHLAGSTAESGKNIMLMNDCKACHKEAEKSIGPSFMQVAMKYKADPGATEYLAGKIRRGGSGVWGETAMSAHPDIAETDVQQIVQWVLSLGNTATNKKSLPPSGSISPALNRPYKENNWLYLTARYTNKVTTGVKPLTGSHTIILKNSKITFGQVTKMKDYTAVNHNGNTYLVVPKGEGWFSIDSVDLTAISGAELSIGYQKPVLSGYDFEIRLDKPDGTKLAGTSMPASPAKSAVNITTVKFAWNPVADGKVHDLYVVTKARDAKEPGDISLVSLKVVAK